MELQTIIFIGRSGSGKGVQSELFRKYLTENSPDTSILYIETGSYFRRYVNGIEDTWKRARRVMELGQRQPEFLAVWMWTTAFIDNYRENEHLVFDGAPRAVSEARVLETVFPFFERKNPTVVFIGASEVWVEERMRGRGREDDINPDVVARRLAYFKKDVMPVIEYYRNESPNCRLVEINGEQPPEKVHADILAALGLK